MFVASLLRGSKWQKQSRVTETLLPRVREALVDYLAGSDNQARLREFLKASRGDVGTAVMSFEGTVSGSARDRLCELALELALVHDWCEAAHSKNPLVRRMGFSRLAFACWYEPCRRVAGDLMLQALDDPDDDVTLSASRGLVQSGVNDEVERVFEHTVSRNLLVRILITDELRRYAIPLCERAIPKELQSGNSVRILHTLELAAGWERALPLSGVGPLLHAKEREVRLQALRLASLVADAPDIRKGVLDALADTDPEIFGYAARAASRQHLEAALPALSRSLRTGTPEVARAAADALAEMPPRGWETLEELRWHSNLVTARAATEALARVKVAE